MKKPAFPSDQQDKFMLRLPEGMRDRIKAAADQNNRSMNAEILKAIDLWLSVEPPSSDDLEKLKAQEMLKALKAERHAMVVQQLHLMDKIDRIEKVLSDIDRRTPKD